MSAQQHPWERRLLAWAAEGLEHEVPAQAPMRDTRLLDQAYAFCDKIARQQGRTFYKASSLLPDAKRRAVRALYAFCRITDDIVDRAGAEPEAALAAWKQCSLFAPPLAVALSPDDLVVVAWADTEGTLSHSDGICRAVDRWCPARSGRTTRYASFDDLAAYCYGVASTVGLLSMTDFRFSDRVPKTAWTAFPTTTHPRLRAPAAPSRRRRRGRGRSPGAA